MERIEAPPGVHVVDHVTRTWLSRAPRPLIRREEMLRSEGARDV